MGEEKSTVLGIRLDTEERKRFDEFVKEEGKNNKEFINTLLNLYELNKGKTKNVNLIGDIETLEGYTNKIHQTFINIIDKLENQKGDIIENSNKDLQIYKEKVNDLQNKINELKSINSTNDEKLTSVNNDNTTLKEKNNQLQNSLKDKLTIIEEYQGKNDTLTGLLNEYKGYKVKNEELNKLLEDSERKNNELNNTIKENNLTIENLNKDLKAKDDIINNLKLKHEEDLKKVKQEHQQQLEQLKKENELNIKLAVAQEKEELNNKLSQHYKEIETYNNKYLDLVKQLEEKHTTKTITTKSTTKPKKNNDNIIDKDKL